MSLVAGTKGVDKAAKGARVADAVGDVGRLTDDLVDDLPPAQRLPEFVDGARHVDPATGRTVIDACAGTTGDWSATLDQPIEPNVIYRTDNGYLYHTDEQSRVRRVEGDLGLDYDQACWPHRQDTIVRENGVKGSGVVDPDQGGHLIARMFGGPGESINLIPMRGSINQGEWGDMEQLVEKSLKNGYQVQADIRLHYPDEGLTRRPERMAPSATGTKASTIDARNPLRTAQASPQPDHCHERRCLPNHRREPDRRRTASV